MARAEFNLIERLKKLLQDEQKHVTRAKLTLPDSCPNCSKDKAAEAPTRH